jgi:hypothetical protein
VHLLLGPQLFSGMWQLQCPLQQAGGGAGDMSLQLLSVQALGVMQESRCATGPWGGSRETETDRKRDPHIAGSAKMGASSLEPRRALRC